MVETTFTLTRHEVASAIRLTGLTSCFRLRTLFWAIGAYAIITLVLFIATRFSHHPPPAFVFILGFFGACVAYVLFEAVLYGILWPLGARRQMRILKDLNSPIHYRCDDAGWHVRTVTAASDTRWETYTKWAENADMLLIYQNSRVFQMIPKRALTGPHDLDRIRAWLTNAGVPRVAPFR